MKRTLLILILSGLFCLSIFPLPDTLHAEENEVKKVDLPTAIPTYVQKRITQRTWKEKVIDFPVRSATIGDLDGDGKNELITTDGKTLRVVQWKYGQFLTPGTKNRKKKRFFSFWTWKHADDSNPLDTVNRDNRKIRYISLDSGDLNGDGRDEILYRGIQNGQLLSGILSFQGNRFQQSAAPPGVYLKILRTPEDHPFLAGQSFNPGREGTRRYHWEGEHIRSAGPLAIPPKAFLYAAGNYYSRDANRSAYYVLSEEGELRFYGPDLQEITKINAFRLPDFQTFRIRVQNHEGKTLKKKLRVPNRMLSGDYDQDGRDELLLILQRPILNVRLLRSLWTRETVADLVLANGQIREYWDTQPVFWKILDQAVGDIDNNGKRELVLFTREGILPFMQKTRLLIYELP